MQGVQEIETQEGRCLGLQGEQGVPRIAANVTQIGHKSHAIIG